MCGLFGVIGNMPNKKYTLKNLSILNMSRGVHSTGYADINILTNDYKIVKRPTDARSFIPLLDITKEDLVIGHTRWATSGKINTKNAHPWAIGNVIGCHNGVVYNEEEVKQYLWDYDDYATYSVDSQYLLHLISYYGHMGNADGSLNLTYWDTTIQGLVLQSYNNPLAIALNKDWTWMCWSSEIQHLKTALKLSKIKEYEVYNLGDEVLTWKMKDGVLDVVKSDVQFDDEAKELCYFDIKSAWYKD